MNIVTLINITALGENGRYERALKLIAVDRRARLESIKSEKDRYRTVAAGVLLNVSIGIYRGFIDKQCMQGELCELDMDWCLSVGRTEYNPDIVYGERGKPIVRDNSFYFSLSHSGDYAVCVVSDTNAGIDIEGNRVVKEVLKKRFLLEPDAMLLTGEYDERIEATLKRAGVNHRLDFFDIWTAKEAYSKLTGRGITEEMRKISYIELIEDDSYSVKSYLHDGMRVAVIISNDKNTDCDF